MYSGETSVTFSTSDVVQELLILCVSVFLRDNIFDC